MTLPLPRFVVAKSLADGRPAFYFSVPTKYRRAGCTILDQPLGRDYAVACGEDGTGGRAAALNALFSEWQDHRRGLQVTGEREPIMERSDGCFRNTAAVKLTQKKFRTVPVPTTTAQCSW
jgi:hypothetical protein